MFTIYMCDSNGKSTETFNASNTAEAREEFDRFLNSLRTENPRYSEFHCSFAANVNDNENPEERFLKPEA